MDKMIIKDLEIYAYHGVNQEEKNMGQKFLISAELHLDLLQAGQTDDLNATVNYAKLCLELEREFVKQKDDLIERGAHRLCEFVLLNYPKIERVKLTLKKPWAPIGKAIDYAAVELERSWHTAYVALGSNLGDKQKNVEAAIAMIEASPYNTVEKISKWYTTKPVGYLDQDDFLNGAIEIRTLMTPKALIWFLLEVEKGLGRERNILNGPRTIDLDVLLYDNIITSFEEIIVPHPRMHEREFVLKPLCDIAPFKMHPVLNQRMETLLRNIAL